MNGANMAEQWLVLKFGGTSVAGRTQWETIASLAEKRQAEGYRVLLVCSAVAGVTNLLTSLADNPGSDSGWTRLLAIHSALSADLGVAESTWLPETSNLLEKHRATLVNDSSPAARAGLLAMGEWLSTRIGVEFLRQSTAASWVDARDALQLIDEPDVPQARRWLSGACHAGADSELAKQWSTLKPILITQGFVARTSTGETALLGRGGSDTSSALLAGRLNAERLEIWTDVPGLFSADPRLIPAARLLKEVDYEEAQEMAASGARVIHPRCIRAAAETQTPVVIRDVGRRQVAGTRISDRPSAGSGVKTITCQQNMIVMLLQNLDARHHVGFLAQVFDVFRSRGVSIDLVATSETTTTVAFSKNDNHMDESDLANLTQELQQKCKVRVYPDCVCVNLVGRGVRKALSRLSGALSFFEERPLFMLSQSANDVCLSLLVDSTDHSMLLREAHQALIPQAGTAESTVFGLSWEELGAV